jgi:hypothetical protein
MDANDAFQEVKSLALAALLLAGAGVGAAKAAASLQGGSAGSNFISVRASGAACDGVTDDTEAIQAVANAKGMSNRAVLIDGVCKVGTAGKGVVFQAGTVVRGAAFQGSNPPTGSQIQCDNQQAYVCVTISGASGSNGLFASGVEGVSIIGVGGKPVPGFIGLMFYNGYEPWARDVKVTNADTCFVWESGTVAYGGIAFTGENIQASKCATHYLVFDGWPEARFVQVRLGDNGAGDYAARDAVLFKDANCTTAGCGPNGISFEQLHINPGNSVGCAFRWAGYNRSSAGVTGEYRVSDSHVEWHAAGGTAVFCSDSSYSKIQELHVSHTSVAVGGAGVPLFAFDAATALVQDFFSDNTFGGCTGITLAPSPAQGAALSDVHFTDNFGCLSASFTSNGKGGNRLFLEHNTWGTLKIAGAWDGAFYSEDNFTSLADSASGHVFMTEPPQTWTPKIAVCPTMIFGCNISAGAQATSGKYQRTGTGGFTASFRVAMKGPLGGGGYVEIDGLPLTCNASQGWSGGAATFANGFVGLKGLPVLLMSGGTGSPVLLEALNADDSGVSALAQLSSSNLSGATQLAATVNCTQTK